VTEGSLQGNAVLLIDVDDLARVRIEPPEAAAKAMAKFAHTERWVGAPIAIMAAHYAIDLPVLSAAVAGYASNPAKRVELAPRLTLNRINPDR
jgi:hypothetical protein